MPSCLVHTTKWEYGRPKHRCSKPEKFHRSCATRLVSRTCDMLPVVASDLLFLLARSTVYGRTRILKTNFEAVLTTQIPEHQTDVCVTTKSTCWKPPSRYQNPDLIISFVIAARLLPFSSLVLFKRRRNIGWILFLFP
jgi:hypothetical protein